MQSFTAQSARRPAREYETEVKFYVFCEAGYSGTVLLSRPTDPRVIQVNIEKRRYLPEFVAEAVGLP